MLLINNNDYFRRFLIVLVCQKCLNNNNKRRKPSVTKNLNDDQILKNFVDCIVKLQINNCVENYQNIILKISNDHY